MPWGGNVKGDMALLPSSGQNTEMRHTLKFGSFFGIPVRIHFTFPLILVAFGVEAGLRGGWADAAWAVLLVLAVFVCVVLHEFGHSLQVRRYGIAVRDIILLPIGGMARAERIPDDPKQEIVVAISGPLVNFALALILFAVLMIRREPLTLENDLVVNLLFINIALGTFNLIPAFPMDGGRILRGLLATKMDYLRATRLAKNVGQIVAVLFVIIGFVDTSFIMLPLIAVFIFFGAMTEEKMVRVKLNLDGKRARDFILHDVPIGDPEGLPLIAADTPATQVYYYLRSHRLRAAAVTEQDGRLLGLLDIDGLTACVG
jgi:Zn-dependent protease